MLMLIIDTFVLILLVRAITGDEEEGFLMPGIIAVIAGLALFGANMGAANVESGAIWIVLGAIVAVALLVALGCFALMGVTARDSAVIGGAFAAYKILISLLFAFAFAS